MGEKKIIIPILIFAAKSYDSGSEPWILQIQQLTTGKSLGETLPRDITHLKRLAFFWGGGGNIVSGVVLLEALANCCGTFKNVLIF